jgi:hypothetical protein
MDMQRQMDRQEDQPVDEREDEAVRISDEELDSVVGGLTPIQGESTEGRHYDW